MSLNLVLGMKPKKKDLVYILIFRVEECLYKPPDRSENLFQLTFFGHKRHLIQRAPNRPQLTFQMFEIPQSTLSYCLFTINIAKGTTDPGVDCFDQ